MMATNQPAALSNVLAQNTGLSVSLPATNAAVEKEYEALLGADDAAMAEVDRWIRENQASRAKGAGMSDAELNRKIRARLDRVRQAYEDFLSRHPNHVQARIAYGSFLGDIHDEDGSRKQWEEALALDPNDPAIYNNLAGLYAHDGPIKKAFEYYAKAISLNPNESVYYYNFGTLVYLFRKDAEEIYHINEKQVFAKALSLYSNAVRLDPTNFPLASDVAQTYYGITPLRTDAALRAWTNALHVAHTEIEREGVYLHFARIKLLAGRFAEAQAHLNAVTNEMYKVLKARLEKNLKQREAQAQAGKNNSPPASGASPAKQRSVRK